MSKEVVAKGAKLEDGKVNAVESSVVVNRYPKHTSLLT